MCPWLFTVTFVHTSFHHLWGFEAAVRTPEPRRQSLGVATSLGSRAPPTPTTTTSSSSSSTSPPLLFLHAQVVWEILQCKCGTYLLPPSNKTVSHSVPSCEKPWFCRRRYRRWGGAGKQSIMWRSNANERSICYVWLPAKATTSEGPRHNKSSK